VAGSIAHAVRQPKAAAVAGLAFGLILGAVIVLLQSAAPDSAADAGTWVEDLERRDAVSAALTLIPFAGIAFLWFLAVVRSELGRQEDRFFETVFLGSGLLFVAMLFAAAAALLSVLAVHEAGQPLEPGAAAQAWWFASELLGSFASRMAAVFTLAVSTAGLRVGSVPRLLVGVGYLTGLMLLLTPPIPHWAQLLFPAWVIALSIMVMFRSPALATGEPSRRRGR
jgi:hypothetical protein